MQYPESHPKAISLVIGRGRRTQTIKAPPLRPLARVGASSGSAQLARMKFLTGEELRSNLPKRVNGVAVVLRLLIEFRSVNHLCGRSAWASFVLKDAWGGLASLSQ